MLYIYIFISYHIIGSYIIYINTFIYIDMQDQIVKYVLLGFIIYIYYILLCIYIIYIGLYWLIYILYISYHVICSVYIICIC